MKCKCGNTKEVRKFEGDYLCKRCINEIRLEPSKFYDVLESPDILNKCINECGKKIEGEKDAIKVLLLSVCGRLVLNSQPTSYNLLVNSESGSGKDYVTRNVLDLFPKDDISHRSRISETAFTYWHNSEDEPDWTWDGKVVYLEDASNAVLNCDVMKTMCSGGSHATITVNHKAKDMFINGKPVIIVTSASANPNKEMLRRYSLLNLDESEEQTEAILRKKAKIASERIIPKYDPIIIEALANLKPYNVDVAIAGHFVEDFPTKHLIIRTHWDRFVDLIKASAILHQYQREKTKEGFIIANGQDYDVARDILIKTTTNAMMIPLSQLRQNLIKVFMDMDEGQLEGTWNTVSELEEKISFCSDKSIRTNCNELVNLGILEKEIQRRENIPKPTMAYRLKEGLIDLYFPTWDEITCRISSNTSLTSSSSFTSFTSFTPKNDGVTEVTEVKETGNVPSEVKKVEGGKENG